MAIESKNLLVWVKAMSRGQALPLDASEVYGSLDEAQTYASSSAIAYPGQTVKALLEDGKYHEYVLQPSEAGYTLEEVGAVTESDLKQYVKVVSELPTTGQEEGILYIVADEKKGAVWGGSSWKYVFEDLEPLVDEVSDKVSALEVDLPKKAPLANPAFTGSVTIDGKTATTKDYVDALFAQLSEKNAVPEIVDSTHPIPTDYVAGKSYRVAEAGTYVGQKCEVGDLILVIADYVEGSASNDDFIVLQANIDGAVTSTADATTVGEIVVFDAVTGKVIKGSGVEIASLNDAIAKAHEHENKAALDTYDKTQTELLASAKSEAEGLVSAAKTTLEGAIAGKADKATTLEGYGITDAYTKSDIDGKFDVVNTNLNTKVTAAEVDTKINEAKTDILADAATAADTALSARVGDIPDETTVKAYIDNAVGSGGTASADAIAKAKQEAIDTSKAYTDSQLTIVEF